MACGPVLACMPFNLTYVPPPGAELAASTPPWRHCIHLWASLLGCHISGDDIIAELAADDSAAGQQQPQEAGRLPPYLQQQVFDALMAAVLNSMHALNLSYSTVVQEAPDAAEVSMQCLGLPLQYTPTPLRAECCFSAAVHRLCSRFMCLQLQIEDCVQSR